MCAGAIVQARIPRVVVGCMNPKAGCARSILNLLAYAQFNHQVELETDVLEEECSQLMKQFFRELREAKKEEKEEEENKNAEIKNVSLLSELSFYVHYASNLPTNVTLAVNSAQAPSRHPEVLLSAASFPT